MAHLIFRHTTVLLVVAATVLMPAVAEAHGRRTSFYVGVGPAYYGTYYYAPYPAYVMPRVFVPPTVVVESAPPLPQEQAAEVRYVCNDPKGVYPEVPACPTGWAELPAVPPDFKPGAKSDSQSHARPDSRKAAP